MSLALLDCDLSGTHQRHLFFRKGRKIVHVHESVSCWGAEWDPPVLLNDAIPFKSIMTNFILIILLTFTIHSDVRDHILFWDWLWGATYTNSTRSHIGMSRKKLLKMLLLQFYEYVPNLAIDDRLYTLPLLFRTSWWRWWWWEEWH